MSVRSLALDYAGMADLDLARRCAHLFYATRKSYVASLG